MSKTNEFKDEFIRDLLKEAQPELEHYDFNREVMAKVREIEQLKDKRRSWVFSAIALLFAICMVWVISTLPSLSLLLGKLNIPLFGDNFSMFVSLGLACFILFQMNFLMTKVVKN